MRTFWLAKYGGISYRQLMYDYDKTKEIAERAMLEFEPDAPAPTILAIATGRALEAIDFKQLQWPGHGARDDQPYQYLDREYMKAGGIRRIPVRSDRLLSAEISAARGWAFSRASKSYPICPACTISAWSAGGAHVCQDRACARRWRNS